jgi:hypothetical protein
MQAIDQFMWAYQTHFRSRVRYLANGVLERISAGEAAAALLVGVRRPEHNARHAVCVEPEDGPWPQALFDGVDREIESAIRIHPLQNMVYDDKPSMRDKPENIRRAAVREEIARRIQLFDHENATVSLCGSVYPVDHYYVCPIIQVPGSLFERFPPLTFTAKTQFEPSELSFIKSCIWRVLEEAHKSLVFPEPGRGIHDAMRSPEEVIARAASNFMYSVSMLIGEYEGLDLFAAFNRIGALKYEGADVKGQLVLIGSAAKCSSYLLRFAKPVRLNQSRWARKLLHLVTRDAALVGDSKAVYGITVRPNELSAPSSKSFTVEFPGHRQWILSYRSRELLRVDAGEAQLPQEPISYERFTDLVLRIFVNSPDASPKNLWQVFLAMQQQPKGHMVMIAADAAQEAGRLAHQGTRIYPTFLTNDVLERACRIDGTILIDPQGQCHAIGVILDGTASEDCTPSRGARFNSAVRYVGGRSVGRMAIVISDDATIDVIPLLRPRLAAVDIEAALTALASATLDNYHQPRLFLDRNRFYLNAEQCERANEAIRKLDRLPKDVGVIYVGTDPFSPDPLMNDSYLC